MKRRAFLFEIDLDNLLGVVPGAAGVGHKDSLIKAEHRDRDQVANKEERLEKSKSQGRKEDGQKNIEHAFLRILGADFHDFLAVLDRRFFHAFQLDVGLDELNRAIGPGRHRLNRCAGKPVNNGATGNQAEHEWGVQQRQALGVFGKAVG